MARSAITLPCDYTAIAGTSGNSFVLDATNVDIALGVYGDITTLLARILLQMQAVAGMGNMEMEITSGFKVRIGDIDGDNSPANFAVAWAGHDTGLRDLLGFTGDLAGDNDYTASLSPLRCWVSTYQRADRGQWAVRHGDMWRGNEARSGDVSGMLTGKRVYETEAEFMHESAAQIWRSRGLTAGGQSRALDSIVELSRTSYPGTGNIPIKGAYYYPDYTDVQPNTAVLSAGDASQFVFTSSPATYAYGHFDAGWRPKYDDSIPVGNIMYKVKVPFHTAPIPAAGWDGVSGS